jgi:putative acetyltransferase
LVRVRSERHSDHERVFAIHEAAFGRPDEAHLVSRLRASVSPSLSLVAELDGRVVGHVFFSPVRIERDAGGPAVAGLAPIGVEPAYQGRGVGSALVRRGLARCRGLGWEAVVLVGAPAYYSRFGFVLAAPLGLRYEDEAHDPVFQVLELRPGALRGSKGRVRFHEAFAQTGTA